MMKRLVIVFDDSPLGVEGMDHIVENINENKYAWFVDDKNTEFEFDVKSARIEVGE